MLTDKTRGAVGFLVFFLLLGFIPDLTLAQGARIGLTPLVFEFTAEPGETIESFIRVSSHPESVPVNILMEIEDMFPEGEEGRVRLEAPLEERRAFSLSHWIKAEPAKFFLAPGEEKKVKFVINVPKNADPGGYYASVVAGTTDIEPGGTGVAILTRIGALILMTVSGEIKENLSAIELTAPSYAEKGPIKLSARFENKGTVHVKPDAVIVITNTFGKKVAEIPLESRNVLPNAVRRIDAEWQTRFLWGKYTATLSGTYGMNKLPLNSVSATFWGFPWKICLLIVILLTFFCLTRKRWLTALRILVKGER